MFFAISLINRFSTFKPYRWKWAERLLRHHNLWLQTPGHNRRAHHGSSARSQQVWRTALENQMHANRCCVVMEIHVFVGLRKDYVSTPPNSSSRGTEPPTLVPPISPKDSDEFTTGGLSWKSGPSALNSHAGQSLPTAESKQGCQSPKLSRLHQQVTQFKLLKLAQKQGA